MSKPIIWLLKSVNNEVFPKITYLAGLNNTSPALAFLRENRLDFLQARYH